MSASPVPAKHRRPRDETVASRKAINLRAASRGSVRMEKVRDFPSLSWCSLWPF